MSDKIAIVGYACRLPGQVSTPDDLWELCTRKRSGWSTIPKDRFSFDAFHHPNPSKPGTFNPKGGYFLSEDVTRFDASFFNLTAKEAISLDPQQRLLLECTFEALESAGIPKENLAGRDVGVYVGGNFADYELSNVRDVETAPMHQATGCAPAMQSNRISYFFDLRGPSMTFDTACSGSLVALHHAVRSLRSGESTAAIVAGCRLNLLPDYFVTMSMSQLFNDTGKTFAFDDRADSGFARGEGAGVVFLKPLEAAIRDRDQIRAVICNTGVGQDGRTQGITNPNGQAQQDLIKKVYREAGLNIQDCGFAEMHGTGTKVGDPIEATAVHNALAVNRSPADPLYIGSVKSNVGHLEGASGIISVIKSAQMLEKELVLPNTNYKKTNPAIPLDEWNMKVLTSTRPWPRNKKYISVNNFGFGGTNAHCVLEKPPLETRQATETSEATENMNDPSRKLFILSANDKESLQARMKDMGVYIEQRPEVFEKSLCGNVAYTLGDRRSHLSYRAAFSAPSLDGLGMKLAQARITASRVQGDPTIGFVFTGQGAQWARMGAALLDEYPVFAVAIDRADAKLREIGADFSLSEELQKDAATSRINSPHISQPACTAVQVGLVDLLQSWGVRPSNVVGHSSGEIAAAYAAGAYDADSAMALAYHRGNLALKLKKLFPTLRGTMIAVGASPDAIKPYLNKITKGYTTIACVNSPSSVTVSGDEEAIVELHELLDADSVFNRQLKIDVAYHSEHMARVSELYLASIADQIPAPSLSAKFFSSVFGRTVDSSELGPAYWVQNLVSTVLFSDALSEMCKSDFKPDLLIELGPHSALKGPIKDTLKTFGSSMSRIAYAPTVLRNADAVESVLEAAGAAYVKGAAIDMMAINFPNTKAQFHTLLTDLPRYPWQHATSYWHEARIAQKHRSRAGVRNDILGVIANYSNDLEPTWRNVIRLDDIPWLRHHKMQGMSVFPLAGYIAMAIEAAQERALARSVEFDNFELREIMVGAALVLNDGADTETTITLRPFTDASRGYSDTWDEFKIYSWDNKRGWSEHCRGLVGVRNSHKDEDRTLARKEAKASSLSQRATEIKALASEKIDDQEMYRVLDSVGASYGITFNGLRNCFSGPEHCQSDIVVQDTQSLMPKGFEPNLVIHPSFLDIFVQLVWPILGAGRMGLETLYMPTMVRSVVMDRSVVRTPGEQLQAFCTGRPNHEAPQPTSFDIFAAKDGQTGNPLIQFEGFVMTPVRDSGASEKQSARKLCYKLVWEPLLKPTTNGVTNGITNGANGVHHSNGDSNGHAEPVAIISNGVNGASSHSYTNGSANGHAQVKENGHSVANGHSNGHTNGTTNGHAEVVENGHDSASEYLKEFSEGYAKGYSEAYAKIHGHTNGFENGHIHVNGNGHTNGNGVLEKREETDLVIVQFGDNGVVATDLAGAIDVSNMVLPPVKALGQFDCDQKRVVLLETGTKSIRSVSKEDFDNLKDILLRAAKVLWVYSKASPESAMSVGLARTVRSENMSKIATLGLDASDISSNRPSVPIMRLLDTIWFGETTEPCKDMEFMSVNGELFVQRVQEDHSMNSFVSNETGSAVIEKQKYFQPGRRLKVQIANPGQLDTIYFADDIPEELGDKQVEIQVKATGSNFKDIVVSLGQLAQPYIGVECSGIVAAVGKNVTNVVIGQRVMAASEGAYSTYARCLGTSVYPIPEVMSFEEAATIPIVFCTAYYGLFDLGRLTDCDRVLIHAAAGGVGQAAIMLAQMAGAEIYATVGSQGKKDFIMKQYSIPEDRIFYSRDISFAADIRRVTNGEGVDVVLNSLAGDILRETWDCLAPFGRFIEIGKADITRNSRLDMNKFEHNCTFASVDLTKVAAKKPRLMQRLLADVCGLMKKGTISPISPIHTYRISEIENAFRALQSGKSMGKLVVVPHEDDEVSATMPKTSSNVFRSDATYIIVGGTGGLGRSMTKWMSSKGARNIVLVSRSAAINDKVAELIDKLSPSGTRVFVRPCNVADKSSVEKLVKEDLNGLPPVRGIVQGAMVLKDMLYEQMAHEDFHAVTASKVDGTFNLHHVLADSPLDFFIALSSVAGIVGNRGQAAYSAANVFLDSFMAHRRSLGLPGVSIDLAAVSNVGYLADGSDDRRAEVLRNIGGQTVDESEVLALFAAAVTGKLDADHSGQCITGLDVGPGDSSFWLSDAKFEILAAKASSEAGDASGGGVAVALASVLRTAPSKEEASAALYDALAAKVAAVLVIAVDAIEPSHTIKSLGLDSLVAIEIRNWIARETDVNVQILELLSSGSMASLVDLILGKMGLFTASA